MSIFTFDSTQIDPNRNQIESANPFIIRPSSNCNLKYLYCIMITLIELPRCYSSSYYVHILYAYPIIYLSQFRPLAFF